MSIAKIYSAQLTGLEAEIVTIEIDISNGLHSFSVVGLGDRSIDEAKDRISAAIKNSGHISPKQKNQKVVISLAPADIRKEGSSFDLAMAVGYLAASEIVAFNPEGILFLGELSLEGSVRRISGILPILCQARSLGFHTVFVPVNNLKEASLAQDLTIFGTNSLNELLDHLRGATLIQRLDSSTLHTDPIPHAGIDMSVIRGNESAKRGLEIAAAGAHNVLMSGPPGTGKTMLAQSFATILPELSYEQSVEVTGIHSAARMLDDELIIHPPFRAPHHTASYPSIVGGGAFPKPGEITLAHRGVLFLDEFPEFDRKVLEALRQPLEDRIITISRARGVITFPAQCILIASMNPCPCGRGPDHGCTCLPYSLIAYQRKISGPILDRVDIHLSVHRVDYDKLSLQSSTAETSSEIRLRVSRARLLQANRFKRHSISKSFNSEMSADDIQKCVQMTDDARETLKSSAKKLELSGRGFHRVIKVARTIADLAGKESIEREHILEALQYREKRGE